MLLVLATLPSELNHGTDSYLLMTADTDHTLILARKAHWTTALTLASATAVQATAASLRLPPRFSHPFLIANANFSTSFLSASRKVPRGVRRRDHHRRRTYRDNLLPIIPRKVTLGKIIDPLGERHLPRREELRRVRS